MIIRPIRYTPEFQIEGYISSRLMAAYDLDDHTIHIEPAGYDDGRILWHYILEHDGRTIFEGSDLRGARLAGEPDPAEAARTVLDFLTLRPGDIESDYFDNYTPAQLAWRDEFAESLSLYGLDYDEEGSNQ